MGPCLKGERKMVVGILADASLGFTAAFTPSATFLTLYRSSGIIINKR